MTYKGTTRGIGASSYSGARPMPGMSYSISVNMPGLSYTCNVRAGAGYMEMQNSVRIGYGNSSAGPYAGAKHIGNYQPGNGNIPGVKYSGKNDSANKTAPYSIDNKVAESGYDRAGVNKVDNYGSRMLEGLDKITGYSTGKPYGTDGASMLDGYEDIFRDINQKNQNQLDRYGAEAINEEAERKKNETKMKEERLCEICGKRTAVNGAVCPTCAMNPTQYMN